jgi:hypothetical protein
MKQLLAVLAALLAGQTGQAAADDLDIRVMSGAVQLGAEITLRVRGAGGRLPEGATCSVDVPPPYDAHYSVIAPDCERLRIAQAPRPLLDGNGMALPAGQFPFEIVATASDGSELGRADGQMLYFDQFTDIRVLIKGIRNPVKQGATFETVVLGAGRPVDASLTCRWNAYGPVKFDATSENGCEGTITALAPTGADGDLDVEIVNLTDMHSVGYGTAKILVH